MNNNNLTVLIDAPAFPLAYWNALHTSVREKLAPELNSMYKAASVAITPDTHFSQAFLETGLCPNVDFDLGKELPGHLAESAVGSTTFSFGKFDYEQKDLASNASENMLMREESGNGPNFVSNDGVTYTGVIPTLINFAADMQQGEGKNYFVRINVDACEKNRDANANIDGVGDIDSQSHANRILGHRLVKPHRYRKDSLNHQSQNAVILSKSYWGENFDRAAVATVHAIRVVNQVVSGILKMCASTSLGKGKMLKDILKLILWTPSVTKPPSIGQVLDGSLSSTEGAIFTNSVADKGDAANAFVSIPEFRNQILRACGGEDMNFRSHSFGMSYVDPKMDYLLSRQGDSDPYWSSVYLSHGDTWVCVPFSVSNTHPVRFSDETNWIVTKRRGVESDKDVSMSNIRPYLPESFKIFDTRDRNQISQEPFVKHSGISLERISDVYSTKYPCLRIIRIPDNENVAEVQTSPKIDIEAVESIQRWWKKNNGNKIDKNKNKNTKIKNKNKNKIKMPKWKKKPQVRHVKSVENDQTLHVYRNGVDVTPVARSVRNDGLTVYHKGCACSN